MRRPGRDNTASMDEANKTAPAAAKKRKTRESDMTREKWRAIEAFETKSRRTVGEDASKLIVEVTPGKRGGEFPLPFGGQMNITAGLFSKKDVVTCCMVSPSNRFKYQPPLRLHDKLLSEIYLFSTSSRSVKNGVFLRLPRQAENTDICDIILMVKSIRNEEWVVGNFQASENGRMVEFEAEGPGIYVVISSPKTETFDLPIVGTLYNTKLSKQISVRLPKKATDTDLQCKLQIIPLNRGNLPALREDYPRDMDDLVTASDYYDLRPSVSKEFRRPCTVKLPLPPFEDDDGEELPTDDLAVLYEVEGEWHILDVSYKFTKTSVSFDTRILTRFCVALARPQRRKRLKEIFRHIEEETYITRGEIIPFIHLADKCWTLWFDVVANRKKEETIAKRVGQGFRKIDQMLFLNYQSQQEQKQPSPKKSWRTRNKPSPEHEINKKVERYDLDLMEGKIFDLEIGGDIRIAADDPGNTYTGLQFHERLAESYRRFIVEPHPIGQGKTLTGIIKVVTDVPQDDGTTRRKDVRTFDFDVEPETVQKWFYVEPEPEPEPEPQPTPATDQQEVTAPKAKAPTRPQDKESWLRLITPTKPPRKVSKESRVLSGRSLMVLAREVEQGLTLAIYLDLNDSTITGMGFDALAKGQSLIDITYRILMLWKRKSSKLKEGQIDQLVQALEEMGRRDVAEILVAKHTANEELTPDCFGHES